MRQRPLSSPYEFARRSTMSRIAMLVATIFVASASTSVLAQTSPSGVNSTSPGSGPQTGGSYSPANPLPPIVTTPIGGSMSSSNYGEVGTSLGSAGASDSGVGASTRGAAGGTGSAGSGFGSSTGAGRVTGSGSLTGSGAVNVPGSTAPQPSLGGTQNYVDQAELARCNGMAGAAREDCIGNLRSRMDMNSGVGARSSAGGRIGTGTGSTNGVGIAPGNQLPRPMIGPSAPSTPSTAASNPPMGPASGGVAPSMGR
jgi:hypothetical protein